MDMDTGNMKLNFYLSVEGRSQECVKSGKVKVTVHCAGGAKQKVWGKERKKKKLELDII